MPTDTTQLDHTNLVVRRLKSLGRKVGLLFFGDNRPHYDGEGKDILCDYVVVTEPDERGEWVVWSGCIRGPLHDLRATTFHGYYSRDPWETKTDIPDSALDEAGRRLARIRRDSRIWLARSSEVS